MSVPGELDDSLGEIMINLAAHLSLDLINDIIGVGHSQVFLGDLRRLEELPVAAEDLVEAAAFAGDLVPRDLGAILKSWREREVGGSEDVPVVVPRGNTDKRESSFVLLAKADRGDGPLFGIPEDAEELSHASPLPATVGGVLESLPVHGLYRLGGMREEGVSRRNAEAKAVLNRQAETTDPGKKLDPGQKKPEGHPAESCCYRSVENEVEGEEAGYEEAEGAELPSGDMATTPESEGEDSQSGDEG